LSRLFWGSPRSIGSYRFRSLLSGLLPGNQNAPTEHVRATFTAYGSPSPELISLSLLALGGLHRTLRRLFHWPLLEGLAFGDPSTVDMIILLHWSLSGSTSILVLDAEKYRCLALHRGCNLLRVLLYPTFGKNSDQLLDGLGHLVVLLGLRLHRSHLP